MDFNSINKNNKTSRRTVLDLGWRSAAAAIALGATKLEAATTTSGNRTLVHLQLMGGNDSNNMIIPLEDAAYARYSKARGPLAIPRDGTLPVKAPRFGTARFGFHPAMIQLKALYERNAVAVVAGVGPAKRPNANVPDEWVYIKGGYNAPAWAAGLLGMTDHVSLAKRAITFPSGTTLVSTSLASNDARQRLVDAMATKRLATTFPETRAGRNFKQVAQLILAAPSIGASNPVIFTSRSGFDTHSNELATQQVLLAELDAALGAFQIAMEGAGLARQVTLYTETEFNRTLAPNDKGGTEHGWAGHQLVIGNAVLGGDVYGTFPSMTLGGADDADGKGTWIPTTSSDQYHYTLARWLGTGLSQMPAVFPGLSPAADLRFV